MDLRRLRTMVAIAEQPSFTAAGAALGLSHSAVSLHVKDLEQELGAPLVDRTRRPPALTDRGAALVEHARRMLAIAEEIAALGSSAALVGRLAVGVVPSAMAGLAPPALAALRAAQPRVSLRIRTALSGDLADLVRAGDLDAALVTAPETPAPGLRARIVAREPLEAIAPADAPAAEDALALLRRGPFIWFSRKTWAGQQIERALAARGLPVDSSMEVDSLEAVEALVRHGLGVSVAPRRVGAPRASLLSAPLGSPPLVRALALIDRPRSPKAPLIDALHAALIGGDQGRGT
jgi:DNA-binding transcriptional LysR family regulator